MKAELPLYPIGSGGGSCDGDAEGGEAVREGEADLEFGGLAIEGEASSRHRSEADAERRQASGRAASCSLSADRQGHAKHDPERFRFGAASAVMAAPVAPDGPAEALGGAQRLIPDCRPGAGLLSRLGVAPGRNDRVDAPVRDGIAAAAGVAGAIGSDGGDLLICRNLAEQVRQHGCVAHAAAGNGRPGPPASAGRREVRHRPVQAPGFSRLAANPVVRRSGRPNSISIVRRA